MEQKLDCEIVRDLFPLYVEKITSEVSNSSIEEHVNECGECRSILEQMSQKIEVEPVPEVQNFKKYMNRSKGRFAYLLFNLLAIISVAVCWIVNIAVDRKLTWSWIVTASVFSVFLVIHTGISTKKHRLIKMTAVANVCTFVLLGVIQIVVHSIMGITGVWFFRYALPITLLWSAVIWITIASKCIFKTNIFISIAILTALSIPGNALTDIISGSAFDSRMLEFVLTSLITVVLFITGIVRAKRKKV